MIVYGISRWTNASRASARHIDRGDGKPLCKSKRKVSCWETESGEPTCNRCITIYDKLKFVTRTQHINEVNALRSQNKLK